MILVEQLYSTAQLTRSKWELEVDPTLSAGDCILSSHRSLVDLTLSSRIDTVFESLRNQHAHLSVTAGTMDDTSGVTANGHVFCSEKGAYYKIPDDEPQFARWDGDYFPSA